MNGGTSLIDGMAECLMDSFEGYLIRQQLKRYAQNFHFNRKVYFQIEGNGLFYTKWGFSEQSRKFCEK